MRILIANEGLTGGGGVETYLATLVPALQARGHVVGILHDNPASEPGPQRIAPEGTWHAGVRDEGSVERAIRRVSEFAPDVCFSHNMRRLEIDAALTASWPVVKMMHCHFGTCVSGQKAFSFPSPSPCPRTFGPGCLAHYLPRRCGEANPLVIMKRYRWGSDQRGLFSRYRAIVVASRYMRDEYVRAGAAAGEVHAIPLFAPLPAADIPVERARPIDVLFLGRLTALKGPDVLLDAVARAGERLGRRLTAVFAGLGPRRSHLQQAAAARGLDVAFPGWVVADDRNRLLRDAALLAVPSRWHEPFGLVGLEGAAFGTPAVAFDTGGIGEWLSDGVNGRLVDAAAGAEGMAAGIGEILERGELRSRLSHGAFETLSRFTLDGYVRDLMAVLSRGAGHTGAAA